MTEQELMQGYEQEITYQQHMIENLGRWFSLFFTLASVGLIFFYFFAGRNQLITVVGSLFTLFGFLGMLLFGYGIYRGRLNLQKVILDLERKLTEA
ncbi:DUF202 domain-containing protein [Streptococcus danieliae]|uniref:DUF202 domain-containing protein n=1 Tax=Streptococcus danieliae TaxID=747656 RepID=A0A7X3KCC6_9STRE|nr:DUF202 domain-containing protein [Streptococcus danieliae]MBF0845703.1 DUF202 domain-containing protein [Streptococcus danieliae]MVX59410.1 DUF202 domain-containing protein [Streptococcus danieliae]